MSNDNEPPFPDEQPIQPVESAQPVAPKPKRQGNYKNANYKLIELNDEQKAFIATHWANPEWDLKRITQHVFNDPTLDGHHTEGKSVRAYISTLGTVQEPAKPRTTATPKKGRHELTPEQKTNIEALLNQEQIPSVREIFKVIFPEMRDYNTLCPEYQAVARFIRGTNEEAMDIWEEPVTERRYKPPLNWPGMLGLVNRCVGNPHDINRSLYVAEKLKAAEERNIKALYSYIRNNEFILRASQYDKKADRESFISTFVRNLHDKAADLTADEVDAYLDLCTETIQANQINREVQHQQKLISDCLNGEDDEEGSKARLSMSLVESINSLREKLDKSKKLIHTLRTSVAGSRKDRLDSKKMSNDYLGNWFALWVEEQTRKDLIALGKKEHEEDAAEHGRIKSMDDSWALIAGMTEDEARAAI